MSAALLFHVQRLDDGTLVTSTEMIDVPDDSDSRRLSELQRLVGGNIESVPTDNTKLTIWANENGVYACRDLPNQPAMQFWAQHDPFGCVDAGHLLFGPVIVEGPPTRSGNTTPCPDWVLAEFGFTASV